MKPIKTRGTNSIFGAEGYPSIPAQLYEEENLDGIACIQTVWQLTDEEIEYIAQTKKIYVSLVGETMQPIAIGVTPFANE